MTIPLKPFKHQLASLKHGAHLAVGVDHPRYTHSIPALDHPVRAALVADLA